MQPGHEECGYSIDREEISALNYGGQVRVIRSHETLTCYHDHLEPVQASDVLGNGPTVADYCLCCDTIMRRPEYA